MRTPACVVALGAALAIIVVLSGCAGGGADRTTAATSAPASGGSATPTAPSSAAPDDTIAVALPSDCRALVPADRYDAIFLGEPLNAEGTGDGAFGDTRVALAFPAFVLDPTALSCTWATPRTDTRALFLRGATPGRASADSYLDALSSAGFTCSDVSSGRQCQSVTTESETGYVTADTVFARDGIVVEIIQQNFPTNDLVGTIVEQVWA